MPHPRIEILDKATIDKIAAGEVVERPASVMKELLENALDAGSSAVTAEIRDGGISFLRVTDNGGGIPADQMRTAFLRHATSKLRQAEELTGIRSLGFRGEALSSISAVAKVECISRTPDAVTGCRIVIEGGTEKEFEEIGAPSGTTIVVRNLFFNTPARAKFLKTPMTEGSHVSSIVEELALSHPKVSFKYIVNGQTKLFTSGNGNLKEIAWQIFGRDLAKEMIHLEDSSDLMRITGFIGTPKASRGNRNLENYFVNGRFVRDRIISKAIEDAYHGFLMQHRFPFTLLYLEIDPEKVDVNVHPSKMEIRISSQEEIYHQLCLAVQNALMNREQIPEVLPDRRRESARKVLPQSVPEPFEKARRKDTDQNIPEVSSAAENTGVRSDRQAAGEEHTEKKEGAAVTIAASEIKPEELSAAAADKEPSVSGTEKQLSGRQSVPAKTQERGTITPAPAGYGNDILRDAPHTGPDRHAAGKEPRQQTLFQEDRILSEQARRMFRLIGQVFGTYWLIEYGQDLLMIDQHAAHEKIMYERLMKAYREKKILSQMLYPAVILHPGREETEKLRRHLGVFREMGFEIEEFGGRSFKISAVPSNLFPAATEALFIDILGRLDETGRAESRLIPEKIASMSCKAAVKGEHPMSAAEANAMIDELLTLEDPYHCPHGRPAIIRMSRYELDKKFRRIV